MLLLNLAFILQRLEERPDAVCGNANHEMTLKDVRLMSEMAGQKLDPNYLYVLRWDRQPRDVIYPPYMICIGGGERRRVVFQSGDQLCDLQVLDGRRKGPLRDPGHLRALPRSAQRVPDDPLHKKAHAQDPEPVP